MTEDAKKTRALVVAAIGGISFGFWQRSFFAAIAATTFLIFFGGLVVAIQHGLLGEGGVIDQLIWIRKGE